MEKFMHNWIIIAGNSRNTYKTSMACKIISENENKDIVGVKISPHFHELPDDSDFIIKSKTSIIIRENKINNKDSSRMLRAGAKEVYYVQAKDDNLPEAFKHLEELISNRPVVCESGGLRKFIQPSVFIMMKSAEGITKENVKWNLEKADIIVEVDEKGFQGVVPELAYDEKKRVWRQRRPWSALSVISNQ